MDNFPIGNGSHHCGISDQYQQRPATDASVALDPAPTVIGHELAGLTLHRQAYFTSGAPLNPRATSVRLPPGGPRFGGGMPVFGGQPFVAPESARPWEQEMPMAGASVPHFAAPAIHPRLQPVSPGMASHANQGASLTAMTMPSQAQFRQLHRPKTGETTNLRMVYSTG